MEKENEWIYDNWDEIHQKKRKVRQIPALDLLVKQRKQDDSSSRRVKKKASVDMNTTRECKQCSKILSYSNHTCSGCGNVLEDSWLEHPTLDEVRYKYQFQHYSNIPCMYKRINHFNEKLSQIQGKERTQLDEEIINKILEEIEKMSWEVEDVTPKQVKYILKKLNLAKYYEHCNHITNKINGYRLPSFTMQQEDKMRQMFHSIQRPFTKHSPTNRKNFLNYSYIFHKFMQLLNFDELLPYFSMLKSREKLYEQDLIWKKICEDLNWEYIPSL